MNTPASGSTAVSSAILPLILLAVGLLAATAVYAPGLSGPFFFDDIFNIQNNLHLRLTDLNAPALQLAAFSTNAGPFQRPVSMLSFALNYYFFGEGAASFKAVNLGIHLINGVLIFLLARLLLKFAVQRTDLTFLRHRAALAAALIAALWLVHPINLTSILYVVQRMASLSALFVLLALLSYVTGRLRFPKHRFQGVLWFAAAVLFWGCGLASKENALLLPWYIFLIEWLFFYPLQPRPTLGVRLYTFAWLIVPLVGGLLYFAFHPGMFGYGGRTFTLTERLLTELRALWFYVSLILLPRPAALGIFHDDFPISTSLLNPWTTLPALLGWLLAIGLALRFHRRQPLLAFGILFFLAAHALESSIFPLQIMHEHRNYLAGFGILFGSVATLMLTDYPHPALQTRNRFLLAGIFFIFFGAITFGRALQWQDLTRLILSQVHHHPDCPSSNYEAGRLYIALREQTQDWLQKDQFNTEAVQHFAKTAALEPYATAPLAVILANAGNANSTDPAMIEEALNRLRHQHPVDSAVNNLLNLSRCERQRDCSVPEGLVDRLFQALLANPRIDGELRATLLDELALRAMHAGRFAEAEMLFQQVLAINATKAMFQINYAVLLMQVGRLNEARERLDRLLAAPQPAAIVQLADALKQRIAAGPAQNTLTDNNKTAPSATPSIKELIKPKDSIPLFDFSRGPNPAAQ